MAEDHIRYDILAQDALRGVIRKVLGEVAKTGLPGEHYFQITFMTRAPGVRLASRLLAQHPEQMTIVLQHQFWDLSVSESGFEVGLSFGGIPERLLVPFTAIRAFADPSVQFLLQFEPERSLSEIEAEEVKAAEEVEAGTQSLQARPAEEGLAKPAAKPAAKPNEGSAEIVSIDAFRKKH